METQKIQSVLITLGTIVLMIIVLGIYFVTENLASKEKEADNAVAAAWKKRRLQSQNL